jgi:hypothetical protein
MKVYVDNDERYPDYYLVRKVDGMDVIDDEEYDDFYSMNPWGKEVELSDEEFEDYRSAYKNYNMWQRKLEKLHNG